MQTILLLRRKKQREEGGGGEKRENRTTLDSQSHRNAPLFLHFSLQKRNKWAAAAAAAVDPAPSCRRHWPISSEAASLGAVAGVKLVTYQPDMIKSEWLLSDLFPLQGAAKQNHVAAKKQQHKTHTHEKNDDDDDDGERKRAECLCVSERCCGGKVLVSIRVKRRCVQFQSKASVAASQPCYRAEQPAGEGAEPDKVNFGEREGRRQCFLRLFIY